MAKTINKYYNPTGNPIDERIKRLKTLVFTTKKEADDHAKQTRSYPYPVYDVEVNTIGHAVPK